MLGAVSDLRSSVPGLLEIACDESGYEGEKLIGTTTDVFAHGSVQLDTAAATDCMQELRRKIRSPATQYKANHLLREKHRSVLRWILGPSAPLLGNAHVFLIDKAFFVVDKVVDLLLPADKDGMAVVLYREGRRAFDSEQWEAFLVSANNLMRVKDRMDVRTSVESFMRMVEQLRKAKPQHQVAEILDLLWRARPEAEAFRARLLDDPGMISALDPLIPAIVEAVGYWGEGGKPVSIAHDRQKTLSEERITQLKKLLGDSSGGRLAGLSFVSAETDPRVQVADIIAGAARKIASDELNDRGDEELTTLLRPFVDSSSIWGDHRSWSQLGEGS
ncbi:MAG TPA: hypothetical protein DGT23_34485 [Micromonosporaceae bacterium]|nr:hypothetical protein [Micromonosporaceae bacterium]